MSVCYAHPENTTKTVIIKHKHYCVYCGKEVDDTGAYEDCSWIPVFSCDCEDAVKEREINSKINLLKTQYPKPKFQRVEKQIEELQEI